MEHGSEEQDKEEWNLNSVSENSVLCSFTHSGQPGDSSRPTSRNSNAFPIYQQTEYLKPTSKI